MTAHLRLRARTGLALLVGLLAAAPLVAAPGDTAADQNDYLAVREGARSLQQARDALANAGNKFGGHKGKAADEITAALTELDEAVGFANANGGAGEKGKPLFDNTHGAAAAAQTDYQAIQKTANRLIEAGGALDKGFDKFGGHRAKAIAAIHRALDELDEAVKFANANK